MGSRRRIMWMLIVAEDILWKFEIAADDIRQPRQSVFSLRGAV